jgi:hypothetical protein
VAVAGDVHLRHLGRQVRVGLRQLGHDLVAQDRPEFEERAYSEACTSNHTK